jgi:hypothetical protein
MKTFSPLKHYFNILLKYLLEKKKIIVNLLEKNELVLVKCPSTLAKQANIYHLM